MMRLLVSGGHDFTDYQALGSCMSRLHRDYRITMVLHGDETGAAYMASLFAEMMDLAGWKFKADRIKFKEAAGPIRNAEMLRIGRPHMALTMPGGVVTRDMALRCLKAGVPLYFYNEDTESMEKANIYAGIRSLNIPPA